MPVTTICPDLGKRYPLGRVGERVRLLRLAKLWRPEDLAARSGVAMTTIYRIETGAHEPRLDTLAKIAAALGVEPSALMGME